MKEIIKDLEEAMKEFAAAEAELSGKASAKLPGPITRAKSAS
jgi:hypothetical protein